MLIPIALLACAPPTHEDLSPTVAAVWPTELTAMDAGFGAETNDGQRTWIEGSDAILTNIEHPDFEFALRPLSLGRRTYPGEVQLAEDEVDESPEPMPPVDTMEDLVPCPPTLAAGRLDVTCGSAVAWYRHDDTGLEFGLDLASRPPGDGALLYRLGFDASSSLMGLADQPGTLTIGLGDREFQLSKLIVEDANGSPLPSRLFVDCMRDHDPRYATVSPDERCTLAIEVDDSTATYPIVIDPHLGTKAAEDAPCSAGAVAIETLAEGDLVITEMMINPDVPPFGSSETNGEWIEITNQLAVPVILNGLVIHGKDNDSFTVTSNRCIPASGTVVIGGSTNIALNGKTPVDLAWSNMALNNVGSMNPTNSQFADEVVLSYRDDVGDGDCTSGECFLIDGVDYTHLWRHTRTIVPTGTGTPTANARFMPESASLSLHPGPELTLPLHLANDDRTAWCDAYTQYGGGNPAQFGTPNAPNDDCLAPIEFQFTWFLVDAPFMFTDCTDVAPDELQGVADANFTTGNAGTGTTFARYTYYDNGAGAAAALKQGQYVQWSYLGFGQPQYLGQRDFNAGNPDAETYDYRAVAGYNNAIASFGFWVSPCP